jgi:hypothetical protein
MLITIKFIDLFGHRLRAKSKWIVVVFSLPHALLKKGMAELARKPVARGRVSAKVELDESALASKDLIIRLLGDAMLIAKRRLTHKERSDLNFRRHSAAAAVDYFPNQPPSPSYEKAFTVLGVAGS